MTDIPLILGAQENWIYDQNRSGHSFYHFRVPKMPLLSMYDFINKNFGKIYFLWLVSP